jgi:hypothetical protein
MVDNPTHDTFEALHKKYSKTLICPCSNTAVQFSKFVNFQTTFHQVGTSRMILGFVLRIMVRVRIIPTLIHAYTTFTVAISNDREPNPKMEIPRRRFLQRAGLSIPA